MKKSKILSSAFIMTMVSFGAFGADEIITGGPNTCTVDVLGVSDNNATAKTIATWTPVTYECAPGQYLLETETSVECAPCPTGSYCPGGTYTVESENTGATTCPTTHPNSVAGAGADTQCYTACTVDMVAKATAVTGNDYYGSGVDTCEPTACVVGWHVKAGLNLSEEIGEKEGFGYGAIEYDGYYDEYNDFESKSQEYYTISDNMSFAVDYGERGILTGIGRCSTLSSDNDDYTWKSRPFVNNLTDEVRAPGAIYCYCQLNGYIPYDGNKIEINSNSWLFMDNLGSLEGCSHGCPSECANRLAYNFIEGNLVFRTMLFDMAKLPATCAANTINIDWNPDNNGEHIKNMCTYDGSITVPADPVKPGYTFTGWKLVE